MAHAIDTSTGQAAVFTVGEPPWHGLGASIKDAQTSEQAVALAQLDWNVELWKVTAGDPNGKFDDIACTDHRATVRMDTHAVLGVVGDQYQPFQNRQSFDFMDTLVGEKLAMFESAGALRGGRVVWMLAKIPKELWVTADDEVRPYLLLTNSHDGSMAVRMLPTCVRVVCMNTLSLALRQGQGSGWSIRHCASLPERVEEARKALGLVSRRLDRFCIEAKAMCERQVTSKQLVGYFDMLLPEPVTDRQKIRRDLVIQQFHANFHDPTKCCQASVVLYGQPTTPSVNGRIISGPSGVPIPPSASSTGWTASGSVPPTSSSRMPGPGRWNWWRHTDHVCCLNPPTIHSLEQGQARKGGQVAALVIVIIILLILLILAHL